MSYIAGVELGGTTCVVAVSDVRNPQAILERLELKTLDPASTLQNVVNFLKEMLTKYKVAEFQAIAIASFGPVDLQKKSPTYGFITSTPKPGWQNTDVVGQFRRAFPVVLVLFDTDVNPPAFAEAMEVSSCCLEAPNVLYITVGTGVGVGAFVNGSPIHGLLHPEAGHMVVGVKPGDEYSGCCPFHKSCVEGMVSSKALAARASVSQSELDKLPDSHHIWQIAGYYLGVLCANLTYSLSPDRIVLGGGIMQRKVIFQHCRKTFEKVIAGYLSHEKFQTDEGLVEYICASKFGNDAGIIGALVIAQYGAKKI